MILWGYYKGFGPAWHKCVCVGEFVPLYLRTYYSQQLLVLTPTLYNKQLALLHGILQYPGTECRENLYSKGHLISCHT